MLTVLSFNQCNTIANPLSCYNDFVGTSVQATQVITLFISKHAPVINMQTFAFYSIASFAMQPRKQSWFLQLTVYSFNL